jgi:hypothetical protein
VTPLLLLVSCAAPADAGQPPRVIRFEVPHVIEQAAVPERLFAADFPVTVHAVKTSESPESLVHFFDVEFTRAGLFRMPQAQLPEPMRSLSLTGLDTSTLISYTVIFQPNPDHTTTAIISETYMAEHQPRAGTPEIAALFPGATQVIRSSSEALKTLGYRAPAPPIEVAQFYRDVLPKAGYREVEPSVFVRPHERLQIIARPDEKGSRVTVLWNPL